jgi:hypothetical protein
VQPGHVYLIQPSSAYIYIYILSCMHTKYGAKIPAHMMFACYISLLGAPQQSPAYILYVHTQTRLRPAVISSLPLPSFRFQFVWHLDVYAYAHRLNARRTYPPSTPQQTPREQRSVRASLLRSHVRTVTSQLEQQKEAILCLLCVGRIRRIRLV